MPVAKCKYCQASLKIKEAYKTITKNKTMYFCNEKHFDLYMKKLESEREQKEHSKQLQDKFYKLFCDILGVNGITNTALWKEKAEINKVFTDDLIIAYLEEHKEYLTNAVCKLSGGIYGKIRYVSVVLRNSLGDYRPKVKEVERPTVQADTSINEMMYEIRNTNKSKRKSLADLEDMF